MIRSVFEILGSRGLPDAVRYPSFGAGNPLTRMWHSLKDLFRIRRVFDPFKHNSPD